MWLEDASKAFSFNLELGVFVYTFADSACQSSIPKTHLANLFRLANIGKKYNTSVRWNLSMVILRDTSTTSWDGPPGQISIRNVQATNTYENPCSHISARWWFNPKLVVLGLNVTNWLHTQYITIYKCKRACINFNKTHIWTYTLGWLDACRLRALVDNPLTELIPCTSGQTKVITRYEDSHLCGFLSRVLPNTSIGRTEMNVQPLCKGASGCNGK